MRDMHRNKLIIGDYVQSIYGNIFKITALPAGDRRVPLVSVRTGERMMLPFSNLTKMDPKDVMFEILKGEAYANTSI